jgi:uncharacterized membrane protein YbhN (UPF0104 family)
LDSKKGPPIPTGGIRKHSRSPGFIGTYQWLAVSALGVVGVDGDVAIAFSLLMQAVWFIPTMVVGGVIAIREVHREAVGASRPSG